MEILIDSYAESNYNAYEGLGVAYSNIGQSFTASIDCILSSAKFYIRKNGSPTAEVYARIRAHSGTYGTSSVPGAVLATSNGVYMGSLGTSFNLQTFTFTGANQITLEQGQYYTVELYTTLNGVFSNYMEIGFDSTSPTHSGNCFFANSSLSARDVVFYVYGTEIPEAGLFEIQNVESLSSIENIAIEQNSGIFVLNPISCISTIESIWLEGYLYTEGITCETTNQGIEMSEDIPATWGCKVIVEDIKIRAKVHNNKIKGVIQ